MEIPGCGLNRNKSEQILDKGFTTKPRANRTLQSQTCTRSTQRISGTPPLKALHRSDRSRSDRSGSEIPNGENSISRNPNCTKLEQQLSLDNPSTSAPFPREKPNLTCIGQTGVGHRSDRCESGTSGKAGPRAKLNLLFTRSPDLLHGSSETLGILGVPHGHPVAKRSSPKTH